MKRASGTQYSLPSASMRVTYLCGNVMDGWFLFDAADADATMMVLLLVPSSLAILARAAALKSLSEMRGRDILVLFSG